MSVGELLTLFLRKEEKLNRKASNVHAAGYKINIFMIIQEMHSERKKIECRNVKNKIIKNNNYVIIIYEEFKKLYKEDSTKNNLMRQIEPG